MPAQTLFDRIWDRHVIAEQIVLRSQSAAAQAKVPTIGLLWNDSVKPSPYAAVVSDALRGKGYVVGRSLRFEEIGRAHV